jgi:proteasome lid subunit RPN8/RPN11
MLRLTDEQYLQMVAHCISGLPEEACGLLVGDPETGEVASCCPTTNVAASAVVYTVDPKEHLRIDREAERQGAEVIGVFHSHTHTDAYPSPTDIAQAPDPSWHYVVVSLRAAPPVVRSYAIVEDAVVEESVVVRSHVARAS